jgi:hypothetical protein
VFDLDLWDEGVYPEDSREYAELRARIVWQIMQLYKLIRKLFAPSALENPTFSQHDSAWPFRPDVEWHKLDMVVLESPRKQVERTINKEVKVGIKHSFHLRFPFARIDTLLMLGVFPYLIHHLENVCPRTKHYDGSELSTLSNSWYQALDSCIIQSGIKLPGSQKAIHCVMCQKIRDQEKLLDKKESATRLAVTAMEFNKVKLKTRSRTKHLEPQAAAQAVAPEQHFFEHPDETNIRLNNQFVPILFKDDV